MKLQRMFRSIVWQLLRNVFNRYFIMYLAILFIPFLFLTFLYFEAHTLLFNYAIEDNYDGLINASANIDGRLQSLEDSLESLTKSGSISNLTYAKKVAFTTNKSVNVNYLQKGLRNFQLDNALSDYIFINYFVSGVTVTPYDVLYDPHTPETVFEYDSLSLLDWNLSHRANKWVSPYTKAVPVTIEGQRDSMVSCTLTFPSYSQPLGTAVVFIPESNLISPLLNCNHTAPNWAGIIDENDHIIAVSNTADSSIALEFINTTNYPDNSFTTKINDKQMLVSRVTSHYNNWTYLTCTPYGAVLNEVIIFKKNALMCLIFCVVLALLVCKYFSNHIIKPIDQMMYKSKGFVSLNCNSTSRSLKTIEHNYAHLLNENTVLKEQVHTQQFVKQTHLLSHLLHGTVHTKAELNYYMKDIEFPLEKNGTFILLVINVHPDSRLQLMSHAENSKTLAMGVNSVLKGKWPSPYILHVFRLDTLCAILQIDHLETYASSLEKMAQQIKHQLSTLELSLIFSASNLYNNLLDTHNAYEEATGSIRPSSIDDSTFYWYKELNNSSDDIYFYPLSIESKLIQSVTAGNTTFIKSILEDLYEENFEHRQLQPHVLEKFLNNMHYTLLKLLDEQTQLDTKTYEVFRHHIFLLNSIDNPLKKYTAIKDLFISFTSQLDQHNHCKSKKQIQSILSYIHENYTNPQLSITFLSEHFHLSENYFSRLFKERTGQTYSKYIEHLRIEKAYELLNDVSLCIDTIGNLCGYNSSTVFRRAFKRISGITPSLYRERLAHIG